MQEIVNVYGQRAESGRSNLHDLTILGEVTRAEQARGSGNHENEVLARTPSSGHIHSSHRLR
jgi:hypothetical protein